MPSISASAGIGFNQAYGFNNTPLIFEAVQGPNFTSNTTTSFVYTIGVGVQKHIAPNVSVGIGYEFANWGRSQLGVAPFQTMGNGLVLDNLYTNGILVNITFRPRERVNPDGAPKDPVFY